MYGRVDGTSPYSLVFTDSSLAMTTTLTTGISEGTTYDYVYEACNSFGCSGNSPMTTVLAADVPTELGMATTANSGTDVIISWPLTADDMGSSVTSYYVTVKAFDGSYKPYLTTCDGSTSGIFTSRSCTIAMSVLTSSPFSIPEGTLIVASVSAINAHGTSTQSPDNTGGAYAALVPD